MKPTVISKPNFLNTDYKNHLLKLCRRLGIGVLRYLSSDQLAHLASWDGLYQESLKSHLTSSLGSRVKHLFTTASFIVRSSGAKMTEQFSSIIAHVSKAPFAGLSALRKSSGVNRRMYTGLVLMAVCAPIFYCTYLLFPRVGHNDYDWFHLNLFHLFFLIRFHIAGIFFLIGLYQYFENTKRSKILSPFLGFLVMSLILLIRAQNNDDVWNVGNFILFGACTTGSLILFLGLDYFVWRKFHRADAFEARINGLVQVAEDLPADKWKSMMLTVLREQKEFKQKG